jgi:hypothetical protein
MLMDVHQRGDLAPTIAPRVVNRGLRYAPQSFTPVPGSTLHLGGVGKNRICKQDSTTLVRNGDASGTIAPPHGETPTNGFQKGHPRYGGRRKGGNNHTDLRQMGAPVNAHLVTSALATDLVRFCLPPRWRGRCACERDEMMPRKIEEAEPAGACPMADGRAAKAGAGSV